MDITDVELGNIIHTIDESTEEALSYMIIGQLGLFKLLNLNTKTTDCELYDDFELVDVIEDGYRYGVFVCLEKQ